MDNRYYDNVIAEMKPFLDENNFKPCDQGFENGVKKIAVKYDTDNQTYSLFVASKDEDGNYGEMRAVNTWLFDDTQNAKDAAAVGLDFTATLAKELGLKPVAGTVNPTVELPTISKDGAMTVSGFTKKMLDVFPDMKEAYKEHIAVYGNFLYVNFFGEYLVPLVKSLLAGGNKKQIKKLYDVFEDAYIKGDKDTVNIMIAVICAAAYNDEAAKKAAEDMMSADSHFLASYRNFASILPKNKKLMAALIK
ncbi:MAG: DUF7674 family protein [Acutalibacteraceae bacterium]